MSAISDYLLEQEKRKAGQSTGQTSVLGVSGKNVNEPALTTQKSAAPRTAAVNAAQSPQELNVRQDPEFEQTMQGNMNQKRQAIKLQESQAQAYAMPEQTGVQAPIQQADPTVGYALAGANKATEALGAFAENKKSAFDVGIQKLESSISEASGADTLGDYEAAVKTFESTQKELQAMQEGSEKWATLGDVFKIGQSGIGLASNVYDISQGNTSPKAYLQTAKSLYDTGSAISSALGGSTEAAGSAAYSGMGATSFGQPLTAEAGNFAGSLSYAPVTEIGGVATGPAVGTQAVTAGAAPAASSSIMFGPIAAVFAAAEAGKGFYGGSGPGVEYGSMDNPTWDNSGWSERTFRHPGLGGSPSLMLSNALDPNGNTLFGKVAKLGGTIEELAMKPLEDALGWLGESTVICTQLHIQNRISREVFKADGKFGSQMDKVEYLWYLSWGTKIAERMKTSKILSSIVAFFFVPISKYMAGEMGVGNGSKFGKICFKTLQFICRRIK